MVLVPLMTISTVAYYTKVIVSTYRSSLSYLHAFHFLQGPQHQPLAAVIKNQCSFPLGAGKVCFSTQVLRGRL